MKRDEVQSPAENQAKGEGIEADIGYGAAFAKPQASEQFAPFAGAFVIIGECNVVLRVPEPVHQGKRVVIQSGFAIVVLQDDSATGDALRLHEEFFSIRSVMKYVHKKDVIEAGGSEWKRVPVIHLTRDHASSALHYVNPDELPLRLQLVKIPGDQPVTAPYVQNGCRGWYQRIQRLRQLFHPAGRNQVCMHFPVRYFCQSHYRDTLFARRTRIPSTLRKKLLSTV